MGSGGEGGGRNTRTSRSNVLVRTRPGETKRTTVPQTPNTSLLPVTGTGSTTGMCQTSDKNERKRGESSGSGWVRSGLGPTSGSPEDL